METGKIRFAGDLQSWFVQADKNQREVKIICINGEVIVNAEDKEDLNALRNKIYQLVKGVPCTKEYVYSLLEIAL